MFELWLCNYALPFDLAVFFSTLSAVLGKSKYGAKL